MLLSYDIGWTQVYYKTIILIIGTTLLVYVFLRESCVTFRRGANGFNRIFYSFSSKISVHQLAACNGMSINARMCPTFNVTA